jgi:trehalose-6-phosphate synthase
MLFNFESHENSLTALWPLFHYLTWSKASDGREEKVNWEDYVAVNTQFAQCIASHYRQGDKSAYIEKKSDRPHVFIIYVH